MSECSLIKLQVPGTAALLKRNSNTRFFLWSLSIIQYHLFRGGSMNSWFWNTSVPFSKHLIYRTSPVAVSDSFRFLASNFIKKKTPVKMFIFEFCKICKNIFRKNHLWITVSCVYLSILRSFSDHLFYRAPLANCLFHVQVAEFHPPHTKVPYMCFSSIIIQEEVAIRRR